MKSKRFADTIELLEAKHKARELSYQKVYYHQEDQPLFGLKDCAHFPNYLKEEKFFVESVLQEDNQALCKLFFFKSTSEI